MRILIVAQYFYPETVGAGIWIHQLASDLVQAGHEVIVVTGFPNYPEGIVFEGYRGRVFQREWVDGVDVIRTYLYTSSNRSFWPKMWGFLTFSVTAGLGGLLARRADVLYAILPPLSLGITANILGMLVRIPSIINVQDIWPDAAVAGGLLKNRRVVSLFAGMESLVYRGAQAIVVISEGFRQRLLEKGVPSEKLHVIPNWADPQQIKPLPRNNRFRSELEVEQGQTVVIYSGGITHNSCLETLVDAANLVRDEPFLFVIVGEGVKKPGIERRVQHYGLGNVRFLPFQPLDRYAEVLAAADVGVVTLHQQFGYASVPSKTYKIMASGRPILALVPERSEIHRLVEQGQCGLCVRPEDPEATASALRYAREHPSELAQMGKNGRHYLVSQFSREKVVAQIQTLVRSVVSESNERHPQD